MKKRYRKRKIEVEIEEFDTWNADYTLSLIILPLLKNYKKKSIGCFMVDKEDVPEKIHDSYDEHGFSKKAWEWTINQMIFAFDYIIDDQKLENKLNPFDWEKDWDKWLEREKKIDDKVKRGTTLFGKYFRGIWD